MFRTVLIAIALSAAPARIEVAPATEVAPTHAAPAAQQYWFHPARSPCPAIPYDPQNDASMVTARTTCNATEQAQAWGACVSKQGPAVPSC